MRKSTLHLTGSIAALVVLSLSGCGKETVRTLTPAVVATNPVNGATGVPVSQVVTATFSTSMNPASISGSTFTLTGPGGAAVPGAIAYTASSSTASFTPANSLAYDTVYTATIHDGRGGYAWRRAGRRYSLDLFDRHSAGSRVHRPPEWGDGRAGFAGAQCQL
jgi:hypothetical protein